MCFLFAHCLRISFFVSKRFLCLCVVDGLASVRVSLEEPCWPNLVTASNDLRAIESLRAQALKSPVQRLVVSFTNRKTEGVNRRTCLASSQDFVVVRLRVRVEDIIEMRFCYIWFHLCRIAGLVVASFQMARCFLRSDGLEDYGVVCSRGYMQPFVHLSLQKYLGLNVSATWVFGKMPLRTAALMPLPWSMAIETIKHRSTIESTINLTPSTSYGPLIAMISLHQLPSITNSKPTTELVTNKSATSMLNIRRCWLPKQRKCQGFNLLSLFMVIAHRQKFCARTSPVLGSEIRLNDNQNRNHRYSFQGLHSNFSMKRISWITRALQKKRVLPLFNIAHYTLRTSCCEPGVSHSKLSFTNELRGFQTLWWQFVSRAEFFCHRDCFPKNA